MALKAEQVTGRLLTRSIPFEPERCHDMSQTWEGNMSSALFAMYNDYWTIEQSFGTFKFLSNINENSKGILYLLYFFNSINYLI